VGDACLGAGDRLGRTVAGAHDDARRGALGDPGNAGGGYDREPLGGGGYQHLAVALAGGRERLAFHPPAPPGGHTVESERGGRAVPRTERPQAAVIRHPVAVGDAGAGLDGGRGEVGAGQHGLDEGIDEPGVRPARLAERDADLGAGGPGGASERSPAPDRPVAAMDGDVALEPGE
jgi:hypothetical protein